MKKLDTKSNMGFEIPKAYFDTVTLYGYRDIASVFPNCKKCIYDVYNEVKHECEIHDGYGFTVINEGKIIGFAFKYEDFEKDSIILYFTDIQGHSYEMDLFDWLENLY